jgi:ribonucleoside-diphosphate reductase subunit M1
MYYLRSRAAADAIKFTVDTSILNVIISVHYYQSHHFSYFVCTIIWNLSLVMQEKPKVVGDDDDDVSTKMAQMVCSLTNREECIACGS